MPLLGRDLSSLRNEQKDQHFTHATVIRTGILSAQVGGLTLTTPYSPRFRPFKNYMKSVAILVAT